MTILVTYHTPDMSRSAELCKSSALHFGCGKALVWTREAIEQTDFYEHNREILDVPRGSGLWAWKPYIILDALTRYPDATIVYADAGVEFVAPVSHVTNRMSDVWLFGNMYNHAHWCKGSVMEAMGVWPQGKQCQASVIMVKQGARAFIAEWLDWCLNPGMIDDSPSAVANHPEFKEGRHDQAILTCMADKYRKPLHWWPAVYNDGAFVYPSDGYVKEYPPLFLHHRRRNHEWPQN